MIVRVRSAPKIGFKVLKKRDYNQKEWDKMGLWPFARPYADKVYCNTECRVNAAEMKLFDALAKDPTRIIKEKTPIAQEAIQFSIKINK